jgi:hypothetical protein
LKPPVSKRCGLLFSFFLSTPSFAPFCFLLSIISIICPMPGMVSFEVPFDSCAHLSLPDNELCSAAVEPLVFGLRDRLAVSGGVTSPLTRHKFSKKFSTVTLCSNKVTIGHHQMSGGVTPLSDTVSPLLAWISAAICWECRGVRRWRRYCGHGTVTAPPLPSSVASTLLPTRYGKEGAQKSRQHFAKTQRFRLLFSTQTHSRREGQRR